LFYLLWSLRYGPDAGPNPWKAMGLEWTTPSPPPPENFPEIPIIREEAYAYDRMTPQGSNNTPILPVPAGGVGEAGKPGERPAGAEWSEQ
jgi:heme/copper-type cytochrome/quinol oxidase subunit 1